MIKTYLIHTLSLIEKVDSYDTHGMPSYISYATNVPARVEEEQDLVISTQTRLVKINSIIYMQNTPEIKIEYRITYDSKLFEVVVVNLLSGFGLNEYQQLLCAEL